MRSKYVAVIPCLNEARTIPRLVQAVAHELASAELHQPEERFLHASSGDPGSMKSALDASGPLPVIVVDDGSTDGTGTLAAQAGARVLTHPGGLGKGAALATGLREASRLGFERALVMDGDGQHAPSDIRAFVDCAQRTQAQLIVGNRMLQAELMPWVRRMVNRWMSQRLSKLAGHPLPDSQCGFRLIHLPTWSALSFRAQHFEIESEMLLAFVAAKAQVEFVPIQVIYKDEQTKIHPLRDTWRWFNWVRQWRKPGGPGEAKRSDQS